MHVPLQKRQESYLYKETAPSHASFFEKNQAANKSNWSLTIPFRFLYKNTHASYKNKNS